MAKYIVTDGIDDYGPFASANAAATGLVAKIVAVLDRGKDPTKWHIEEIPAEPEQPKDVPELIPDFEAADAYLNDIAGVPAATDSAIHPRPECFDSVSAFETLLTLCKAWNKADNWEPVWKDKSQDKFSPIYDHLTGRIAVDPERNN